MEPTGAIRNLAGNPTGAPNVVETTWDRGTKVTPASAAEVERETTPLKNAETSGSFPRAMRPQG